MKSDTSLKAGCSHARSARWPGNAALRRKTAAGQSLKNLRTGRRILLVDDDPAERGFLKDILVKAGYFVIPAENGRQAVNVAGRFPFDLILLDLKTPVTNGWDTFGQLTADFPFIPIIITTDRQGQLLTAIGSGAGALADKPVDIPALLQTMEKLLAEPAERHLARLAGVKADFYHVSAQSGHEWPLQGSFGGSSLEKTED